MERGTLTGALDDLHPTAFADVISGNLLAGALQDFLAETGEIDVSDCVADPNGAILQPGATLAIELGGATLCTGYGQYAVTQMLTLNQPALKVSLTNGYEPTAGESFQILSWASLGGMFGTVSLPALTGGLSWDTSALSSSGTIHVLKPAAPTITITSGGGQAPTQGTSLAPITFTLAGGGTLQVSVTSSNHALLPDSGVVVSPNCGSSLLSCSASVTPLASATGTATVTLQVQDAYDQTATAVATIQVLPAPPSAATPGGGGGGGLDFISLFGLASLAAVRRMWRETCAS
ncbi:MAG: hypothetical protein WDM77_01810 [Steroidobacteraceae bacterium]